MFLLDQHVRELRQARQGAFAALRAQWTGRLRADQGAAAAAVGAAQASQRAGVVAALGMALFDAGLLASDAAQAIRHGLPGLLLAQDRYDDALAVLELDEVADAGHHKYWHGLARALAGLGRLEAAEQAAKRSLALSPGFAPAAEIAADIRAALDLQPALEGGQSWGIACRMIELYGRLGLGAEADELAQRTLQGPPRRPGSPKHVAAVLMAALRIVEPRTVRAAALDHRPSPPDDRFEALLVRCDVMTGEAARQCDGGRDAGVVVRIEQALACVAADAIPRAVGELGRLSIERSQDNGVRAALAYAVGEESRGAIARGPPGPRSRKIFNLLPFNDELVMLRLRMAEMAGWVDRFVIVESRTTFAGSPKPLHFDANRAEFAAYADRISHVVVDAFPAHVDTPWARDFHQRDRAVQALDGLCAPDDLVLLTDADEIVDGRAVAGFDGDLAGLRMATYRFFLNYRPDTDNQPMRRTGAVCKARLLEQFGASYLRFTLSRAPGAADIIDDAGWHFTSAADPEGVAAKVRSYAHQEREAGWRDAGFVGDHLARIRRGDLEAGWERCEIDASYPAYIRAHADDLAALIL